MSWAPFATAPDQLTAEMWRDLVIQSGIDCVLSPGDTTGFLGVSATPVRLLAPEQDVDRARDVLDSILGGEPGEA